MKKCPNCRNKIKLSQLLKYVVWKWFGHNIPIECAECKAKLGFNKKQWLIIGTPVILSIVLSLIYNIFVKTINYYVDLVAFILIVAAMPYPLIVISVSKLNIEENKG